MNNTLFIDIRKSDEVYEKHFNDTINYICIPSNMIRFNLLFIKNIVNLNKDKKIYLVCSSGFRSKFIYDKYFAKDNILKKIIVNKNIQFNNFETICTNGIGQLHSKYDSIIEKELNFLPTFKQKGYNYYNLTRILQTILGTVLIFIALLLWSKCNHNKWILWVALIMGINSLINGLTSTCTISKIFINKLN